MELQNILQHNKLASSHLATTTRSISGKECLRNLDCNFALKNGNSLKQTWSPFQYNTVSEILKVISETNLIYLLIPIT